MFSINLPCDFRDERLGLWDWDWSSKWNEEALDEMRVGRPKKKRHVLLTGQKRRVRREKQSKPKLFEVIFATWPDSLVCVIVSMCGTLLLQVLLLLLLLLECACKVFACRFHYASQAERVGVF